MRKWYTDVKRARRDVSKPYNLSFSIAIAWEGRQERTWPVDNWILVSERMF